MVQHLCQAIEDACRAAGITPVQTINSAVAAACAYGLDKPAGKHKQASQLNASCRWCSHSFPCPAATANATSATQTAAKHVMVFDMGGASLNVSILQVFPASGLMRVVGSACDENLGGRHLDAELVR